jgi:hypothetical protein
MYRLAIIPFGTHHLILLRCDRESYVYVRLIPFPATYCVVKPISYNSLVWLLMLLVIRICMMRPSDRDVAPPPLCKIVTNKFFHIFFAEFFYPPKKSFSVFYQ